MQIDLPKIRMLSLLDPPKSIKRRHAMQPTLFYSRDSASFGKVVFDRLCLEFSSQVRAS